MAEMLSVLEPEPLLEVAARHLAGDRVQEALHLRRVLPSITPNLLGDLLGDLLGNLSGSIRWSFQRLGPPQRLNELAALLPEPWLARPPGKARSCRGFHSPPSRRTGRGTWAPPGADCAGWRRE